MWHHIIAAVNAVFVHLHQRRGVSWRSQFTVFIAADKEAYKKAVMRVVTLSSPVRNVI